MATDKVNQENTGGLVPEVDQPGSDVEDWEFVHEYSFKYQSDKKSVDEKSVRDAVANGVTESPTVDDKQADGEVTDQKEEDMTTDIDEKLAAKREKKREKRRAYKKRVQERRAQEKEQEKDADTDVANQNEQISDQNQQKLAETLAEVTFAKKQIDDEIRSLQNAQKVAQNMVDKLNEEMTQKMSGLGIADKETDKKTQKEAFLAELISDWDEYFGDGDLDDWQRLCGDLGLPADLPSKTKCRKAIRTVDVNIRQFLDAIRKPEDVIFFKNVYKLAHWSRKSKKLVPKDLITRGTPMRALMRELSRCY
ncbi:hypothetical protein GCG54_00004715 [Colletotrichum gloeosporioides]|uniref:Uncharacterized protein n=1 Tax=Colletotrichum gloeosporioides TaxID=474922 RepID=A0A8H4CGS4_COLGL|nr:uncharacterized protein GCG54_00004715 [Colletotrichum gloeosporioides]KAF3803544.1 hypothetical protein GCG54_00004715 [Colletotrichum gloeosporioides]